MNKKRNNTIQKQLSGVGMRRYALQKSQCIADTIGDMGRQIWRGEKGVDRYYLLQKCGHDS